MFRRKILAILAALALLSACSNPGSVTTTDAPTPDTTGGDVGIDAPVFPDAEGDLLTPETIPGDAVIEDAGLDCDKLCEAVECGLTGPDDACDCGGCEDGYGCSDMGLCTADCGVLCEGLECGVAGLEGECECPFCQHGMRQLGMI